MSTIYVPPGDAGPEPAWWPGGGEAGGPGGGPAGGPAPRRGWRGLLPALLAFAVAAAAAGAGVAWGAGAGRPVVLTTAQITSRVSPAVVDIRTNLGYQGAAAAGTGIVVTSSGEVLTNNHVIRGATSITATDVGNGRSYRAIVAGYDERADVAVLRLQGASGLATATIAGSAGVRVGDRVVALGNAGGQGGAPSVVTGRVTGLGQSVVASDHASGTAERLTGLIRTDAPIQPGDSGGPLVNTAGQVIGLNTAGSAGFQFGDDGLGGAPGGAVTAFAVPVSRAAAIASQVTAGKGSATVHIGATAFLGVGLAPVGPGGGRAQGVTGAGVVQVVSGSPAASAGLAPGDLIRTLGGQTVRSPDDIRAALVRYHPGDRVRVTWTDQSGQSHAAFLTLAAGPAG